jgi:glucan phosphoethanolaminetransferase (alkaline phosphatase superfamily)
MTPRSLGKLPSGPAADLVDTLKAGLIIVGAVLSTWPELAGRVPDAADALLHGERVLGVMGLAVVWLLSIGSCLLIAFCGSFYLRALFSIVFCASAIFVTSYDLAMSESLQVAQFERMTAEFRFLSQGVSQNQGSFNLAVLFSLPLTVGILLPSQQRFSKRRAVRLTLAGCLTSMVAVLLVAGLCWARGGNTNDDGYPAFIRPTAYWSAITVDNLLGSGSVRHIPAQGSPSEDDAAQNIVLVVDESVVADTFGRDPRLRINPQLGALASYVIDFGAAASGANCSAASNLLLQVGPRFAHAKQDLATYPWIWEYAAKAGYTTTYIDMQNTSDVLHNGMTASEHALIDHIIVAKPGLVADNDRFAGEQVAQLLHGSKKNFIYVNKVGGHFPYDSKYPASAATYKPVLGFGGNPFKATVGGQPASWLSSMSDNAGTTPFKNSYRNAVEWNFQSFFGEIQDGKWLGTSILIYTSDHGQNIFRDRGRANTHCTSGTDAAPSEGRVPLLFITGMPHWVGLLTDAAHQNYGRVSHFNLFATLLGFMGFKEDQRLDIRDPPVWSHLDPSMNFLHTYTEIQTRFGARPQFISLCTTPSRLQFDGRCDALN